MSQTRVWFRSLRPSLNNTSHLPLPCKLLSIGSAAYLRSSWPQLGPPSFCTQAQHFTQFSYSSITSLSRYMEASLVKNGIPEGAQDEDSASWCGRNLLHSHQALDFLKIQDSCIPLLQHHNRNFRNGVSSLHQLLMHTEAWHLTSDWINHGEGWDAHGPLDRVSSYIPSLHSHLSIDLGMPEIG